MEASNKSRVQNNLSLQVEKLQLMEKSCSPTFAEAKEDDAKNLRQDRGTRSHVTGLKKKTVAPTKTSEDINESADAFIKKFRQQLLIQRLESIENYQQMLARGL